MVAPSAPQASEAASTFVTTNAGLPLAGEATAWGCAAAIAYLSAYAAPGFSFQCPGDAGGHQAATACLSESSRL